MSDNDILVLNASLTETKKQRAPDISESEFFEIYVAEQVLKDFEPSDSDIENGHIGGPVDGGLDGLYFLVNREFVTDDFELTNPNIVTKADLVLIQATREPSFQEDRVDKLILLTEDLLNLGLTKDQLKGTYNPVLQAAIMRFKEKYRTFIHIPHDFAISYYYVSKGDIKTINASLRKKRERVLQEVHEIFSEAQCQFRFVGAAQLLELIRKRSQKTFPLNLAESPISPKGQACFIGLVTLRDYYNFIVDENKQIRNQWFESNVRDWQGKVNVNEEIRQSLENTSSGEDFWWLNNGITVIATKAVIAGGQVLSIDDPQIVNGLQTSRAIFNYVSTHENESTNNTRRVLIRVIAQEHAESRDHIIKATNSQTLVPDILLHATEKIHRDIENILRQHGLFYDRRKNYYKIQGKPIAKIIEPLYLAQTIISVVLQRPNDARGRPSTVLEKSYETVFTSYYPIQVYATCSLLMKKVDAFLRSPNLSLERKDRMNVCWYLAMDYSRAITKKPTPNPSELANMSIPTDNELLTKCYQRVNTAYRSLGEKGLDNDTIAKGPDLVQVVKGFTENVG